MRFGNFLAGIATAIAIGIAGVPSSPGSNLTLLQFSKMNMAACNLANEWVVTGGTGGVRNGSPVSYPGTSGSYATPDAAISAAQAGDTIGIQSGSYDTGTLGWQLSASFTSQVRVCSATVLGANVNWIDLQGSGAGSHITFDGLNLPRGVSLCPTCGGDTGLITSMYLTNDALCVGQFQSGQCINLHNTNDFELENSTLGPACCGNTAPFSGVANNSVEMLRLGVTTGSSAFTNTLVTHDVFQGGLRSCSFWPTNYVLNGSLVSAGSCPDSTCTNTATCHNDQIHAWGIQSSTISNNWVWNSDCQAFTFSGSNGSTNSNLNIFGNIIDDPNEGCGSVAIGFQDCGSGAPGDAFAGTFNVAFNSMTGRIEYDTNTASTCDAAGTTWNTIGNIGAYFNQDVGCGTGSGTTVVNQYNYWSTTLGVNACTGTGNSLVPVDPSSFSFYTNTANTTAFDLHLNTSGISGVSGNVPGGNCGSPYTPDLDGNARPSPCDAGADQG